MKSPLAMILPLAALIAASLRMTTFNGDGTLSGGMYDHCHVPIESFFVTVPSEAVSVMVIGGAVVAVTLIDLPAARAILDRMWRLVPDRSSFDLTVNPPHAADVHEGAPRCVLADEILAWWRRTLFETPYLVRDGRSCDPRVYPHGGTLRDLR